MGKKNNKSKSITYKESGVDIGKFEIILIVNINIKDAIN